MDMNGIAPEMIARQVAQMVGGIMGEDHNNRVTANLINGIVGRTERELAKFFTDIFQREPVPVPDGSKDVPVDMESHHP